jgi:hypothetical protein
MTRNEANAAIVISIVSITAPRNIIITPKAQSMAEKAILLAGDFLLFRKFLFILV